MADRRNYKHRIKNQDSFKDALAEHDIAPCQQGRRVGFQRSVATYFGEIEE